MRNANVVDIFKRTRKIFIYTYIDFSYSFTLKIFAESSLYLQLYVAIYTVKYLHYYCTPNTSGNSFRKM